MVTKRAGPRIQIAPRIRVLLGRAIALGPGKADLLEAIGRQGTIAGAARELGMSYMRAWLLVRTMNRCFRHPLVGTSRGGARRGFASLTQAGRRALAIYRQTEADSLRVARRSRRALARLLRP